MYVPNTPAANLLVQEITLLNVYSKYVAIVYCLRPPMSWNKDLTESVKTWFKFLRFTINKVVTKKVVDHRRHKVP